MMPKSNQETTPHSDSIQAEICQAQLQAYQLREDFEHVEATIKHLRIRLAVANEMEAAASEARPASARESQEAPVPRLWPVEAQPVVSEAVKRPARVATRKRKAPPTVTMTATGKRKGRPPGSKNKAKVAPAPLAPVGAKASGKREAPELTPEQATRETLHKAAQYNAAQIN